MTKEEKLEYYINSLNFDNHNFNDKQLSIITYLINYFLNKITNYDIELIKIYNGGVKSHFISIPDENGIINDFSISTENTAENNIISITSDILNVRILNNKNNIISSAKYGQGDIEYIQISNNTGSILPSIYINQISKTTENILNARFESTSYSYKTGKEYIIQNYEDKANNVHTSKNYTRPVYFQENTQDLCDYLDYTFEQYNYINNHKNEFVKGKSKKKTKK